MGTSKWIPLLYFVTFIDLGSETAAYNWTCGLDNSRSSRVYVGIAEMDTYPWMGMLYYPRGKKRFTTGIILVTKQMVIASALEVDRLPKKDFRRVARVVIGKNCEHEGLRVRDYAYHPDFDNHILSAFAMVQLEDEGVADLTPICPPPEFFIDPEFYAMTVTDRCKTAKIRIFKMEHVQLDECKEFYRRTDLDVESFWPTHTVCARALTAGKCIWRSGTALVTKQGRHWRLLGFGVYGPGCRDPARFMDYGMYHEWVFRSVARVGRTAITRVAPNHLIMRRKMSNLQRFGPCDPEETRVEIYTDVVKIVGHNANSKAIYNLSLYASYEYSCIVFRADKFKASYETTKLDVSSKNKDKKKPRLMTNPRIYLRRWCAGPPALCYGFQFLEAHFYVEIFFSYKTKFTVKAYGKAAKIIDPEAVMEYTNKVMGVSPEIPPYEAVLEKLILTKDMRENFWFYNDDYDRKKEEPKKPKRTKTTTKEPNKFDGSPPKDEGSLHTTESGDGDKNSDKKGDKKDDNVKTEKTTPIGDYTESGDHDKEGDKKDDNVKTGKTTPIGDYTESGDHDKEGDKKDDNVKTGKTSTVSDYTKGGNHGKEGDKKDDNVKTGKTTPIGDYTQSGDHDNEGDKKDDNVKTEKTTPIGDYTQSGDHDNEGDKKNDNVKTGKTTPIGDYTESGDHDKEGDKKDDNVKTGKTTPIDDYTQSGNHDKKGDKKDDNVKTGETSTVSDYTKGGNHGKKGDKKNDDVITGKTTPIGDYTPSGNHDKKGDKNDSKGGDKKDGKDNSGDVPTEENKHNRTRTTRPPKIKIDKRPKPVPVGR